MGDGLGGVGTYGLEGVVTDGLLTGGVRGGVGCGVGGIGGVALLGGIADLVVDALPEGARGAPFQAL